MTIAIFGKKISENFNKVIYNLLAKLTNKGHHIYMYTPFYDFLKIQEISQFHMDGFFDNDHRLPDNTDFLICIGGDGTFLDAITHIGPTCIPIVGINSGRLGFLANISGSEVDLAMDHLIAKNYSVEERSLIALKSTQPIFDSFPYALNDFTIRTTGPSLATVHVSIDGNYLNSYWCDGIIICTPTGSTAYSLSLGGPIVTPYSHNFIITPIAAHNLNVRPLVIPDDASLSLSFEGRTDNFLATLDSRHAKCLTTNEISLGKASFFIRMIRLPQIDFYATLRNKLMWGVDKRN
jgi:NAD+ kinase